METLQQIKSAM